MISEMITSPSPAQTGVNSTGTSVLCYPTGASPVTVRTTGSGEVFLGLAKQEMRRLGVPPGAVDAAGTIGAAVLPLILGSTSAKLRVVGTTDFESSFGFTLSSVLIPIGTAARIDHLSFSDPNQMLSMLSGDRGSGWRMLVVTVTDERVYEKVRAGIEAMGLQLHAEGERFGSLEFEGHGFLLQVCLGSAGRPAGGRVAASASGRSTG